MTTKARAGWWWIDRWRKSTAYTDMSLAEQGAYRNLLDELWLRGGVLPNDERILAKICGDALAWPEVRAKVLARFQVTDQGLRHETHDEVAAGTDRHRDAQAEKGAKRAAGAERDGTGRFQPKSQPNQPDTSRESSRDTSLPSPYTVPTADQGESRARAAAANPLIDRDRDIREGYALIEQIKLLVDLDGTEILAKASEWKGRGRVDLASMYDNRLAHTLIALKAWLRKLRGEAEPTLPARASPNGRPATAADVTRGAVQEVLAEEAAKRGRSSDVRDGPGSLGPAVAAVVGPGHVGRVLPGAAGRDGRRRVLSFHRGRGETLPLGILPERPEAAGGAGGVPW